jgi:hypothetical protein
VAKGHLDLGKFWGDWQRIDNASSRWKGKKIKLTLGTQKGSAVYIFGRLRERSFSRDFPTPSGKSPYFGQFLLELEGL